MASDLLNEFSLQTLKSPQFPWFKPVASSAPLGLSSGIEILAFVGTWCPDCQALLPELIGLVGESERVRFFGVGRDKKLLPWTERYRIVRVPTFVVLRDGVEIGRVIEKPQTILKEDLTRILTPSLQETYAQKSECFGCGPSNKEGLRIRSRVSETDAQETVAEWFASAHHEAFPGMLNGGIIGSLLDCHCNWTAAYRLMLQEGATHPPCTVTADYSIKLLRPTPTDQVIHLSARVAEIKNDRATIEGTLTANGKVCATCRGTFVAVKQGHPAYHRW